MIIINQKPDIWTYQSCSPITHDWSQLWGFPSTVRGSHMHSLSPVRSKHLRMILKALCEGIGCRSMCSCRSYSWKSEVGMVAMVILKPCSWDKQRTNGWLLLSTLDSTNRQLYPRLFFTTTREISIADFSWQATWLRRLALSFALKVELN